MARVTVEDCTPVVENRFDLVLLAAQRARGISRGSELTLERDDDKNPVVALREIAAEKLQLDTLREGIVRSLQKHFERDEPEEEDAVEAFARSLGLEGVPPDPAQMISEDLEESGMRVVESGEELDAGAEEALGDEVPPNEGPPDDGAGLADMDAGDDGGGDPA